MYFDKVTRGLYLNDSITNIDAALAAIANNQEINCCVQIGGKTKQDPLGIIAPVVLPLSPQVVVAALKERRAEIAAEFEKYSAAFIELDKIA